MTSDKGQRISLASASRIPYILIYTIHCDIYYNRLHEAIQIDVTMYSVLEKMRKKIPIYKTFCLFSEDMVFMTAKFNLRQYVVFIKPRTFETADIKLI